MITTVARAVMAMTVRCLGHRRREWALAMEVEFEVAASEGRPLGFALGCLAAAWREMPAHEEGRLTIAGHVLAVGLIVPAAGLLISGVLTGFPFLPPGPASVHGLLTDGGREISFNDAYWSAMPALAVSVLLLGIGHLLLAWAMLERDWARVIVVGKLNAALATTLVIFTSVLFLDGTRALLQAAVLAVELTAVSALARWHDQLSPSAP